MSAAVIDTPLFTYAALTQWGNVFIVPIANGWCEVRFQERYQADDGELLGTFRSEAAAIEAACAGTLEMPSIEVCLSEMSLPEDIRDWERHLKGWRK